VPVRRVGKLTLNRNPTNFFAETEQVAFCVANVVPGIGFTNDPLMQARLFSYLDTQLTRLGGPNFAELPINRPVAPVRNHQQDGFNRHTINVGRANYHPNSTGGGCPFLASAQSGGFVHFPEEVAGTKARVRSETFADHFSQAAMFFRSLSAPEQDHLVDACRFELAKVESEAIRARVVELFGNIDAGLAARVADRLGLAAPAAGKEVPKDAIALSPALSIEAMPKDSIKTRQIAALIGDGVDAAGLTAVRAALEAAGARLVVIAKRLGTAQAESGAGVAVDKAAFTTASVEYDAVFIPGGAASVAALRADGDARHFVLEAYRHCKTIGASGEGVELLRACGIDLAGAGVVITGGEAATGGFPQALIAAIQQHRHWDRPDKDALPA
jgi:catalase